MGGNRRARPEDDNTLYAHYDRASSLRLLGTRGHDHIKRVQPRHRRDVFMDSY